MDMKKRLGKVGSQSVFEMEDKDMEIAILKGMLTATENQLMKYLDENEQLKELLSQK